MSFDPAVFPRQLRYWTLHCCLNALPSFVIAAFWLELIAHPPATLAMLTAIGTFIVFYATVTSFRGPLASRNHILARSLHLGAKIRVVITVCSLPLLLDRKLIGYTPDFWCGFAALWTMHTAGVRDHGPTFLLTFSVTLLEGFLLSFLLLMISFFALLFLQARERRKIHAPG